MSSVSIFLLGASLMVGALGARAEEMQIIRVQEVAAVNAPSDHFTRPPKVRPIFTGKDPSSLSAGAVSFSPRARSAWHTHPKGQFLVVTKGVGLVQELGKAARIVREGDVIWTPPGVRHWHGATEDSEFSHLAIQESEGGSNVNWLQKVTDQEYQAAVKSVRSQPLSKLGDTRE